MWKFLIRSVALGLTIAAITLFFHPDLKKQNWIFNFTKETPPPLLSFKDAVFKASPAVVNIYNRRYNEEAQLQLSTQSLGAGVIMSADGDILTNYHVIAKADQIIVALQDGQLFLAQLMGHDERTDLAVLKIHGQDLPIIPQNEHYQPFVGDMVMAIGNPYNLGQTTTLGIISATGRTGMSFYGPQDFLQTDAAINQGNSGGALINSQGDLVGINTASFQQQNDSNTDGISFAIPYKLAHKIMKKLIVDGQVIRGYIGIDGRELNPTLARLYNLNPQDGVLVMDIDPAGPAAKGGIKPKDILIAINNEMVTSLRQALDIVTDLRPNRKVPVSIKREGKLQVLQILIGIEPKK
jgi:serine protease DegS